MHSIEKRSSGFFVRSLRAKISCVVSSARPKLLDTPSPLRFDPFIKENLKGPFAQMCINIHRCRWLSVTFALEIGTKGLRGSYGAENW